MISQVSGELMQPGPKLLLGRESVLASALNRFYIFLILAVSSTLTCSAKGKKEQE